MLSYEPYVHTQIYLSAQCTSFYCNRIEAVIDVVVVSRCCCSYDSFYYLNFPITTLIAAAAGPSILFMFYELIDHYYGISRLLLFLLFCWTFLLLLSFSLSLSFFILYISFLLRFLFICHLMTLVSESYIYLCIFLRDFNSCALANK